MKYIKELPEDIQKIVLLRQQQQGSVTNVSLLLASRQQSGNFNWEETPEGMIWAAVDDGDYESFYTFHRNISISNKENESTSALKYEVAKLMTEYCGCKKVLKLTESLFSKFKITK